MKFEKTDVWGFEHAIRGMRNPYDSWNKSDSGMGCCKDLCYRCEDSLCDEDVSCYVIGENDMKLATSLIKGGSEHRKFLRQIVVSVDITAPFYWWKQFSTYKIGVVENSCSTMHTLSKNPITMDCFEMGDYSENPIAHEAWRTLIPQLEKLRLGYLKTKEKAYWKELVRLLPESWLQKRTVTLNYENLLVICKQRKGHRLVEWKAFIDWVASLPYASDFIFAFLSL